MIGRLQIGIGALIRSVVLRPAVIASQESIEITVGTMLLVLVTTRIEADCTAVLHCRVTAWTPEIGCWRFEANLDIAHIIHFMEESAGTAREAL